MNSVVDRVILVCRNPRGIGRNYWHPIRSVIREKRVKSTLRTHWGRFKDRMTVMCGQADLSFRNLLARFTDGEREGSARTVDSGGTSHPQTESQPRRHWPLKELSSPVDYLAKCRRESLAQPPTVPLSKENEGGGGGGKPAQSSETYDLPDPFSSEELEHYLVRATNSTNLDIQLQSVPKEDPSRSRTYARMPTNTKKNRYKNNTPYDDTRVVLEGDAQSDYINASYIEGNEGPRIFIATQGPKETNDRTIDDFWRMVWQNRSNVIVMLGNLIEGGRGKVSQYWPDFGMKQKYGLVEVEKKSIKHEVNWIRRHLVASQGSQSRDVLQYHFIKWPDHDVPHSPYGAARMIEDMLRWHWSGPPVIHCSAGLGRTGTFLLVLRLLDDLQYKGCFKPLDTLHSIRKCRANLLDNQHQYRFAHHILLEILYGKETRLPVHHNFTKDKIPDQYKDLNRVPRTLTYKWARSHDVALNRHTSVLPPDGRHIPLGTSRSKQYVNAVRVRDSNLRDTFLVAEHPMSHTVGRCWRLAYMTRALAWVFLHNYEESYEDFPSILPPYGCCELEGVTVQLTSIDKKEFFTERSITLVSNGVTHKIRVLHFKNWSPTSDLPFPLQSLIFLVMRLQEIRESSDNKVIMVSCSDGYSASGVLVSLMRMVAEIDLTRTMDVYRTVQSLRFDRPQFIISQDQYLYLHDAAVVYFKSIKLKQQQKNKQVQQTKNAETNESEHEKTE
ncbi:hypothetical protein O3P69_010587 [Scylla paramamosain]|uniref:Uncharacterized protein n=1 Tax=Scylla paramamosain TaxID=85552 RepID=A0AAW0TDZ9_SCYPA